MSLGMSELLTKVGDNNIEFQRLGSGYFQANENTKDCKISFATKSGTALAMERGDLIGLVVWLKKEDVDRVTKSVAALEAREGAR